MDKDILFPFWVVLFFFLKHIASKFANNVCLYTIVYSAEFDKIKLNKLNRLSWIAMLIR